MHGACHDKILYDLCGESVASRVANVFVSCHLFDEIVFVVRDNVQKIAIADSVGHGFSYVTGGESRAHSVMNGLKYITKFEPDFVVIHDCARPLVTCDQIVAVCQAAVDVGAAVLCRKTTDSIAKFDNVLTYIDRDNLVNIETPQAFRFDLLFDSYVTAMRDGIKMTDDASCVVSRNDVKLVVHESQNLKLTVPSDLKIASTIVNGHNVQNNCDIKIGCGYDIHALVDDRKLILGGLQIPYNKGLYGHSDADVLLHAIIDAILGAAGLPDIGQNFPDDDPKFLDISSIFMLKEVYCEIQSIGFEIGNLDAVVIAEYPKLSPYISDMRHRIAECLQCDTYNINIKAKTNEGFDAVGEGRAIAAQANVILLKKHRN